MESFLSEESLRSGVGVLVRLIEVVGIVTIFIGAIVGLVLAVISVAKERSLRGFSRARLALGRFLAMGLEFQLASDLLQTAIAPTFEEIGKLAAVAAIRTALNFFLAREIQAEREEMHRSRGEKTAPTAVEGAVP